MGYFTVQITILYVVLTDFLLKIIKLGTNIGELKFKVPFPPP